MPTGPGGAWMIAFCASRTRTGARPFSMNTFIPAANPSPLSVTNSPPFWKPLGGVTCVTERAQLAVSTQTLLQQRSALLLQSASTLHVPVATAMSAMPPPSPPLPPPPSGPPL